MSTRLLLSLFGAGVAITAATSIVTAQRAAAPPLVITAYNGGAPTPYTVPRTPWGDPDLQGVWSSDDTSGIPRERPKELGNNLYLSDQAFAARVKQVEQGVKRGESDIGSFRNDFARRAFRQTSLIVDPPDGTMPAVTRGGAEAPRVARPRHVRRRSVRHDRGLHALRPLHHPRHRRLGAARRLRQRQPHRAGAGHGGIQLRDDSRHAHHLHRRPAARRRRASVSTSVIHARDGKATSSSS